MPSWAVVRLIAGKEARDLLRDRRTLLLVLGLPAVLYPLFGTAGYLFVATLVAQPTVIGVVGAANLPAADAGGPPLLAGPEFAPGLVEPTAEAGPLVVRRLDGDPAAALRAKDVDVVLSVPPGFAAELAKGPGVVPEVTVTPREGDDKSKTAVRRLDGILSKWQERLKADRLRKAGLSPDFDKVIHVRNPQTEKPKAKKAADELRDAFARVFPFVLMMWLLAGAIHPAVDMTAGEKERGTMETLLVSPAERSEIVFGKFLATAGFAFLSVAWNVLWLGAAALFTENLLGFPIVNPAGTAGCVILALPLALLFSAVCVALGVFAKSTKEGQYYLLPLVFITMPLALASMTPGADLGPGNFWVPVTGAMLFQQRLLSVAGDPIPWNYFGPILAALAGWIGLALAFAVWQFRRESVLFREGGGRRRLFRRRAGGGT